MSEENVSVKNCTKYMSFKITDEHKKRFKILLGAYSPMSSSELFMHLIDEEYNKQFKSIHMKDE